MTDFRDPKFLEDYQYVSFYPDTAIAPVGDNDYQKLNGYRFSINSSTDPNPFDWHNSYISVKFKLRDLDNTAVAADAQKGTVNSIYSFFEKVIFKFNGVTLNQSPNINRCVWVKNLLKYSKPYETAAENSFDYFDYSRSTKTQRRIDNMAHYAEDTITDATKYNPGFRERHLKLFGNREVDAIISLNRYGFFENLKKQILPQASVTIDITLENSNNLVYRTGGNPARVIFTHMMLYVPKLIFNGDGNKLYLERYLITQNWTYLRESYTETIGSQSTHGSFTIATSIKQPRHVFVWAQQANRDNNQEHNIFFAETFSMGNNNAHLTSSQLELAGGYFFPTEVLNPWEYKARAYRQLLTYGGAYSDPLSGPQISFDLFKTLYPIIYFDLTNQPEPIRSGDTKITFRWQIDDAPGADHDCKWCAVVLNEETIRIDKGKNKITLI